MSKRYAMAVPKHIEYRTIRLNTRAAGKTGKISGYASHFGSVDSYGTAVQRGAFSNTLKKRAGKIPVLWNHDADHPIGIPSVLKEDQTGLYFKADIVEGTGAGADVMALLRRGTPLGMSFGFETVRERAARDSDLLDLSVAPERFKTADGAKYLRVIEEVRLWEISVVTFAANELATIDKVRKSGGRNRYGEFLVMEAEQEYQESSVRESERNRRALMEELIGTAS